jgi:hypothetical protein
MFINRRIVASDDDNLAPENNDPNPAPVPSVAEVQAAYPNGICRSTCTCAEDYPLLTGGKLFPNSPRHQWLRDYLRDANEKTDLDALEIPTKAYLKAVHQQSYWGVLHDFQKQRFAGVSTRLRHHPNVVVTNRGFNRDAKLPPCIDHLVDGDVHLDQLYCEQVHNKRREFFYSPVEYLKNKPDCVTMDGQLDFDVAPLDRRGHFLTDTVRLSRKRISVLENTSIGKLAHFTSWGSMPVALRRQVKRTMTIKDVPATILAKIHDKFSSAPAVTQDFGAPVPQFAIQAVSVDTATVCNGDIAHKRNQFPYSATVSQKGNGSKVGSPVVFAKRDLKRALDDEAVDSSSPHKKKGTINAYFKVVKESTGKEDAQEKDDDANDDDDKNDDDDDDTLEMSSVGTSAGRSIGY